MSASPKESVRDTPPSRSLDPDKDGTLCVHWLLGSKARRIHLRCSPWPNQDGVTLTSPQALTVPFASFSSFPEFDPSSARSSQTIAAPCHHTLLFHSGLPRKAFPVPPHALRGPLVGYLPSTWTSHLNCRLAHPLLSRQEALRGDGQCSCHSQGGLHTAQSTSPQQQSQPHTKVFQVWRGQRCSTHSPRAAHTAVGNSSIQGGTTR